MELAGCVAVAALAVAALRKRSQASEPARQQGPPASLPLAAKPQHSLPWHKKGLGRDFVLQNFSLSHQ